MEERSIVSYNGEVKGVLAKTLAETKEFAGRFLDALSGDPKKEARVIGLRGDLGAGKTTFVKGVAEKLGIREHVTSPTFVLMKIYELSESAHPTYRKLIHVDAYRLESSDELLRLGWQELLENHENLILIEWPERVEGAMPEDISYIDFEFVDENTRNIKES